MLVYYLSTAGRPTVNIDRVGGRLPLSESLDNFMLLAIADASNAGARCDGAGRTVTSPRYSRLPISTQDEFASSWRTTKAYLMYDRER